jgi:hypothetical protein
MYTDSIFVKTDRLEYNTETAFAVFGSGTNAWRDSYMLSANAGWYNRNDEVFLFNRNVHILTRNQEAWADSLKYYKIPNDAELFGNVELLDTTRNVSALAGYMQYIDSLSYVRMTRDPAVIAVSRQDDKVDTVYFGADTLIYWTQKKCDIDKSVVSASEKRLEEINSDAITAYRQNAAKAAAEARENARRKMEEDDPNSKGARDKGAAGRTAGESPAKTVGSKSSEAPSSRAKKGPILPAPFDEYAVPEPPRFIRQLPQIPDTLKKSPSDSLKSSSDSLAKALPDTTKIGFLVGKKNVKVFRNDMQVVCDSLDYTDLDSLVRLYKNPIVWNEIKRQYSADSISVMIENRALKKASLMSNAFIAVQEDSLCFDQIKGTEMMAYFDSTGALSRFDSMGGASGLFFIEEQGVLATVNKFESKMLTATFKSGELEGLTYYEAVKTDAYPVVQLKGEDRSLKGFEWQPEKRPSKPSDITKLEPRETERFYFERIPQPKFRQTDKYFPGYMESVYKMLARQDSLKRARREAKELQESLDRQHDPFVADSLKSAGSLKIKDSLSVAKKTPADSLLAPGGANASKDKTSAENAVKEGAEAGLESAETGTANPADTTKVPPRSLTFPAAKSAEQLEKERLKAEKDKEKAEAAARKAARAKAKSDAKEARWAVLDARDSVRNEAKAARALVRKRKATLKAVRARDEREAKEQKVLEQYIEHFRKQKARGDARKARKSGHENKKETKKEIWKEGQE